MDRKATGTVPVPRMEAVTGDGGRALKELGLPADAAVLDVGTGKGNFAIFLASQGYQVVTGEPETDQTIYARQDWASAAKNAGVLDRIRFQAFDANKLPFESEAFDAVFFFGVLHHIDQNQRSEAFREALRVARRNGAVVFLEPREEMVERIRVEDAGHPLAANPSDYRPDSSVREQRIEGALMDIFIYTKSGD